MTSLAERAIVAAAALLVPIRTASGWATECGAIVLQSPVPVQLDETLYWRTSVYEAEEQLTGYSGGPAVRAIGVLEVGLNLFVDTATQAAPGKEALQHQRIKTDHRKALSPASGGLADDTGEIGHIEHLGCVLLPEFLSSGVVIVRTRIVVHFTEAWGDPSREP